MAAPKTDDDKIVKPKKETVVSIFSPLVNFKLYDYKDAII